MKKLLRWGAFSLMLMSGLAAPWVAVALYSPSPLAQERGAWGMLNERLGRIVLYLTPGGTIQKLGASNLPVGELDVRELYVHIADVGAAASHYIVVPSTGTIIQAWATTDITTNNTLGTNTILTLYSNRVGGEVPFSNRTGVRSDDAKVTAFSITLASTDRRGDVQTDDSVNFAVQMGDRLAIMTDGGTAFTPASRVTLLIRME